MASKKSNPRLATYRKKRNFRVTSEPAPSTRAPPRARGERAGFMVHKHDATRLHYDLRLEMEGVLASWAIPKGPSYDPGVKRLAVQTEDHPLEYGSFEGRIPDGEYGAGDSLIWDRGHFDTDPPGMAGPQREKGHLVLELDGEKLHGRWHLVRTRPLGGKDQWLFFKAKDGQENPDFDVVAERPESVQSGRRVTRGPVRKSALRASHPNPEALLAKVWPPMKATLARFADVDPRGSIFEVKYDGFRALAGLSGGRLALHSRNQLDLSGRFPEVARALAKVTVGEAVIDGEVVALDPSGVSRFQRLQEGDSEHRFIAFDLLWLEGHDLRQQPLEDRRELLESLLANAPLPLQLSERVEPPLDRALQSMRERGMEGLICKRRGSTYQGVRSRDWLKLKISGAQELAILGFTPIKNGRKELGALLVGVREGGQYRFAGKVGTGFTAKTRKELRAALEPDRVEASVAVDAPRMREAVWVEPKLVAQVAFTEWTRDGKLRHPAFQGLRADKRPEECVREIPAEPTRSKESAAPAVQVALSSPTKVIFPQSGITKEEVFRYYQSVAEAMVPALAGRPLTLQQWPSGIGKPGFFRQAVPQAPEWATTHKVQHDGREVEHLVVDRPETLVWLANQNALTLHIWSSRVPHLSEPDWVVFDLDPGEGTWEDLIQIATTLRGLLEELNLSSVPKTSGQRGLHVLVPMARGHTHDDARDFAVAVTRVLEQGLPQLATTERTIAKRGGRLYLDAFQNGFGKTVVAPYSLRAKEGAPASAPLKWSEVTTKLDPTAFNLKTMRARLDKVGNLFTPALQAGQRLPRFRPDEK